VVDDHPASLQVLTGYAHELGLVPTAALGGEEALRFAHAAVRQDEPFRLVLTDCQMPVMDGFELARRWREDPALSATPIVLLSSLHPSSFSRARRDVRIEQVLTKPVTPDELAAAALAALSGPALPGAPAIPARAETAPAPFASLRVLVAEDNSVNQRLILRVLEKMGHSVRIVGNGREAVAAAGTEPYDVVVMDCQMPEMDGFEATRLIRTHSSQAVRDLPILALTAHALAGDRERCLEAGMTDYLTKPVDSASLAAMIEALAAHQHPPVPQPRS